MKRGEKHGNSSDEDEIHIHGNTSMIFVYVVTAKK